MSDVSKLSSYAEKLSLEAKQSLNKLQSIGSVDPSWVDAKDYTHAVSMPPVEAGDGLVLAYLVLQTSIQLQSSSRQINLCQNTTSPPATLNIVKAYFPRQLPSLCTYPDSKF